VPNNLLFNRELIERIIFQLRKIADDNKLHMEEYISKTGSYTLPYCMKFSLRIKNQEYLSWGNGTTKDEATFKSIAELIERLFYSFSQVSNYNELGLFGKSKLAITTIENKYPQANNWLGETTSGIAIHSNLSKAKEAAVNELVERHVILKAHALQLAPYQVKSPKCLNDFKIPESVRLNFYQWQGPLNIYVCVCHIQDSYGQTMYSFGASKNQEQACEKAFFESSGMIIASEQNHGKFQTSSPTGMDIIRDYHLEKKESEFLSLLNNPSKNIPTIDTHIQKKDIYWTKLSTPEFLSDLSPIVAAKAISPLMQPLFYEIWSSKVINPAAINLNENSYPKDYHVVV
jgi:hypothetical protein